MHGGIKTLLFAWVIDGSISYRLVIETKLKKMLAESENDVIYFSFEADDATNSLKRDRGLFTPYQESEETSFWKHEFWATFLLKLVFLSKWII